MKAPQDQTVTPFAPNEVKVVTSSSLACEVEAAADSDHWKREAEGQIADEGNEADTITYTWSATGGVVTPDPNDPKKASWSAPNTEGTYTLKCTFADGGQVSAPETGTRDDTDLVRSVAVQVVVKTWDVGLAIGKKRVPQPTGTPKVVDDGRMLQPQDQTGTASEWKEVAIEPLQTVDVAVESVTDLDHWIQLGEGEEADETSTKWTCDKGTFQKKNADGVWEDVGQELTGGVGKWRAPKGADIDTTAKLTCTMDDKPKEIVAPDKGTRDDDALKREVTIRVVPKIWEKYLTPGQDKGTDGSPIANGYILAPQNQTPGAAHTPTVVKVKPGGSLLCFVSDATDWDKWKQNLPEPTPTPGATPSASPSPTPSSTREKSELDRIQYTWTASSGYFGNGKRQMKIAKGQSVTWYAPTPQPTPVPTPPAPGSTPEPVTTPPPPPVMPPPATITCAIDDLWPVGSKGVTLPDGGDRNDDPVLRTVTVTITPDATDADHTNPPSGGGGGGGSPDSGSCGDGSHWDSSRGQCVSDDEAQDGKIIKMRVSRANSGIVPALTSRVAAGGLPADEHWARIQITITDENNKPLPNVPVRDLVFAEELPGLGNVRPAQASLDTTTTNAGGKIWGWFNSSDYYEDVRLRLNVNDTTWRTITLYQEWNATPKAPQDKPYFGFDEASPVNWKLQLNDEFGPPVPINGHGVEFEVDQLTGVQRNEALGDYEFKTFMNPNIPPEWRALVTYGTPTAGLGGVYTGDMTAALTEGILLESVGTKVKDKEVWADRWTPPTP